MTYCVRWLGVISLNVEVPADVVNAVGSMLDISGVGSRRSDGSAENCEEDRLEDLVEGKHGWNKR